MEIKSITRQQQRATAAQRGDVILDFDRSRALKVVQQRLQDFAGTIQTDAYEVYRSLERKESRIARIGCLAHSRRRFYAALQQNLPDAVWFINQIRLLYQIDAGWRSAVIYSILVSCRRHSINPQDYLTDVLRRLPGQKINRIDELLPGNWKPPTSTTG